MTQQTPERPARRYPRTFMGLIASLIVLVPVVLVIWLLGNANRDEPSDPAPAIDWKPLVADLRENPPGFTILAPDTLPKGWKVTSARITPSDDGPIWELGIVTDDSEFLGFAQADVDASVLEELHDDVISSGDQGSGSSDGASSHSAYVVYGSASASDAAAFASSLR